MDETTANVVMFGIFMGLPVLCITIAGVTRMILDYLRDRKK